MRMAFVILGLKSKIIAKVQIKSGGLGGNIILYSECSWNIIRAPEVLTGEDAAED